MKVLWLAPIHYNAGADVHPAPWISALARKLTDEYGVELTMLNYAPRLSQPEIKVEKEGIRYIFLKTPVPKLDHLGFFRRRIGIIRKYLKSHASEYNMIHVHGSEHQYEACVANTGLPYVISMQGVMGECLKQLTQRWNYTHLSWWMSSKYERHYLSSASEFICRTHFDSGFVRSCNPDAFIHTNWEMIRPEFFQDLGSDEPKKLLYMGGTHPIKGLDICLEAVDILRKKHRLRLQILGKADQATVAALIAELNLEHLGMEDIDLLGFQDVKGVVAAMDSSYLLLHTSLIDNSPNSVCEAQVAGLPVVCTNVGGTSSLIRHGKTGMLSSLDPIDIADKAHALLCNPELHATLKKESSTMARLRHDPQTIADRTMAIYRKVIAEH